MVTRNKKRPKKPVLASFLEEYEIDEGSAPIPDHAATTLEINDAGTLLSLIGGRSFNYGSIRTFTAKNSKIYNRLIGKTFPVFKGIVECITYNWDGTIFAVTTASRDDIEQGITIFNPGTGECANAPMNIAELFYEIVDGEEDMLNAVVFLDWLKDGNPVPLYDECVGYTVPLFLDGNDDFTNMGIIDLEVYWDITGQIIQQI